MTLMTTEMTDIDEGIYHPFFQIGDISAEKLGEDRSASHGQTYDYRSQKTMRL